MTPGQLAGLQLAIDHGASLDSVFQQLDQMSDDEHWALIQARWPAVWREDFFKSEPPDGPR